ncbi:MAG: hypothetical protein NTV31_17510 [Bacteroidia bacterium]|nr:hypothetical protein [Bacteroidia bacterium]MCX6326861.1 hypothetical protein [Bacteroidia bacterium]
MENNERIVFNNSFGTVSDKRIILNYKNGSEDIPIKQISSVSFERKQNILFAIFYLIIGIGILVGTFSLEQVPGAVIIVALVLFILFSLVGIAYYMGNYQIKISVSGRDKKPIRVELAKTKEGRDFSEAIRRQIIS